MKGLNLLCCCVASLLLLGTAGMAARRAVGACGSPWGCGGHGSPRRLRVPMGLQVPVGLWVPVG